MMMHKDFSNSSLEEILENIQDYLKALQETLEKDVPKEIDKCTKKCEDIQKIAEEIDLSGEMDASEE
jgi:hypothetical protein